MTANTILACHGTAILSGTAGILIRGASGSGKSMLALALIDDGARLIADDRVTLSPCHGRLVAIPPSAIAGLVELRGVGIVRRPVEPMAIIRLCVDLVPAEDIERLPADAERSAELAGLTLPRQAVPSPASAGSMEPAKLLIRQALGDMQVAVHHKALHLPRVSP